MKPCLVSATCIWTRLFADEKTVVNMPPVFRRGVCRIDAKRFDGIDCLQNLFDRRPA
jgi:hypothetical protein